MLQATLGLGLVWGLVEFLFYLYVKLILVPHIQPLKKVQKPFFKDPIDMLRDIFTFIETLDCYTFERFCIGFCLTNTIEEVYTENLDSLFAWIGYTSHLEDLTPTQRDDVTDIRNEAIERFGISIKEGFNPSVRHAKPNLEPIIHKHRPLLLYVILYINEYYTNTFHLYGNGFRRIKNINGLYYWYRKCELDNRPPILLLHGITRGWSYYFPLINSLYKYRTIILLECDCVRVSSLCFDVPDPITLIANLLEILDRHNLKQFSIIAHSYGTFMAGWLVKSHPDTVSHLTLIDPVALSAVLPESTYAIHYKPPKTISDYLLYYCVRTELSVMNTLQRNFVWYNIVLRFEDIPNHIGVVVATAGNDDMLCVTAINEITEIHATKRKQFVQMAEQSQYQSIAGIVRLFWKDYYHGQALTLRSSCTGHWPPDFYWLSLLGAKSSFAEIAGVDGANLYPKMKRAISVFKSLNESSILVLKELIGSASKDPLHHLHAGKQINTRTPFSSLLSPKRQYSMNKTSMDEEDSNQDTDNETNQDTISGIDFNNNTPKWVYITLLSQLPAHILFQSLDVNSP
eukprot:gene3598-7152_t